MTVLVSEDQDSAFVGVKHGEPPRVPAWLSRRVSEIGREYGYWYEGDGGDRANVEKALGDISWKGSWDRLVKGAGSDFYYVIFSNSASGTADFIDRVQDPDETILDALAEAGDDAAHEALHGRTSKAKLEAFLRDCAAGLLDFAETKPARKPALLTFVRRGATAMWPPNWRDGPTPASRVALRANEKRLSTIVGRPGVYFLGQDHIPTLRDMDRGLLSPAQARREAA